MSGRGKLIMSCGCEETEERPGSYVMYGTHDTFDDGSYGQCIAYAHMCRQHVDGLKALDVLFFDTEEAADAWLSSFRDAARPPAT